MKMQFLNEKRKIYFYDFLFTFSNLFEIDLLINNFLFASDKEIKKMII